jgi:alpha-glucoside transport system permease protein
MASGRAVPGVPVLAQALDQVRGSAVTGADGTFRITVPPSDVLGYALVIPAATVAPPWSGPQWLGPGWIWFALATAFVWAWVGFAAALFRAGLAAVPADLLRMARAEGVGRIGRLRTVVLPLLRPVTAVILLTLVVTAVRLFDLVLVLVPGSMQPSADVVALNWWRDRPFRTPGESAALAMLLFAIVAAVALFGLRGLRHSWPGRPTGVERRDRTRRAPWLGVFAAAVVAVLWAFPLVNLVATAFRTPQDAAVAGWWMSGRDGASLASFAEAAGNGLATALPATAVLAMSATALVLVVAAPAAYLLAWGDLPRWLVRAAVVVLTLFAVVPVQAYAAPLGGVVARLGLAGARTPLILVHGALGVPFAVLLLRAAFAGAPPSLVAEARLGEVGRRAVFEQVLRRARPALVAVAVLEFVQVWNDLAAGLLISGPGATPLTLVLWGQARQFATSAGPVAAGAVLSAVVPVAVLLAAWPTVVRGLTGGARR